MRWERRDDRGKGTAVGMSQATVIQGKEIEIMGGKVRDIILITNSRLNGLISV